ncbi:MAG: hypothetical protein IJ172_11530 [Ruminococcus sp.]|nr:hypothetical protein [Ruminococcus sp.]
MNSIITVFATDADLSVNVPFIVEVLFILLAALPYIAIIVSLICMIVRKWQVAALISVWVTLFAVAYMGIDSIITILLLGYSVIVCGIAIFVSVRKKRLEPQQEETSESVIEEIDKSYKIEDKDDDWDFL